MSRRDRLTLRVFAMSALVLAAACAVKFFFKG